MDEIVSQYLPQAFAFIYVINSANAGGVQKDRVSNESSCVSNRYLNVPNRAVSQFSSSAKVFSN